MSKIYFVSDLHLFASRSIGDKQLHVIESKAREADVFVLGGDIFDFKWARRETVGHACEEAIHWLRDLATDCPSCEFHYLLGNHDYHDEFTTPLAALEKEVDNLFHEHFFIRRGSSVFLHGDVADEHMDAEALATARQKWTNHKQRGHVLSGMYDVVTAMRIHSPIPFFVYPHRVVAKRIITYLNDIGHGSDAGVRNVYFGHTHRPMSHYQYGGLLFHNGGAPIKGVKFRILEAVE